MVDKMEGIPYLIQAGDTLDFTVSYNDYKASEYTLEFYLVNASNAINFSATTASDGIGFDVLVPATSTGEWAAGDYNCYVKATEADSGHITTIYSGQLVIVPDITMAVDTRSHAKIMLDTIEAFMRDRTAPVRVKSISGRSLQYLTPQELREEWAYWRAIVEREKIAERPYDYDNAIYGTFSR